MTEDARKKMSKRNKGNKYHLGKHFSEEAKRKISDSLKKAFANPELRKRMSEAHTGLPSPMKGKHLSEEEKKKISEAVKKAMVNPEIRRKISESRKGKTSWMKGKHHTEESIEKNRLAHIGQIPWNKGKKPSIETIRERKEHQTEYRKEWYKKNKERRSLVGKKWYEKNRERIIVHRKERTHNLKEDFLLTYKKGKSCVVCGWNEHPEILQFHHKDRGTKKFTIGNIAITERITPKNIELVKQEINKCILLCPNCHAVLHLKERRT